MTLCKNFMLISNSCFAYNRLSLRSRGRYTTNMFPPTQELTPNQVLMMKFNDKQWIRVYASPEAAKIEGMKSFSVKLLLLALLSVPIASTYAYWKTPVSQGPSCEGPVVSNAPEGNLETTSEDQAMLTLDSRSHLTVEASKNQLLHSAVYMAAITLSSTLLMTFGLHHLLKRFALEIYMTPSTIVTDDTLGSLSRRLLDRAYLTKMAPDGVSLLFKRVTLLGSKEFVQVHLNNLRYKKTTTSNFVIVGTFERFNAPFDSQDEDSAVAAIANYLQVRHNST